MAPVTFSHIGISVTDLDKAVEFYSKVVRPLRDHGADHDPAR